MNRIDICKNIIQSVKEYITDPLNMEVHRARNHFVRNRLLSMFQVVLYLLYSRKSSMFQNISGILEDLPDLDFPNISKQALSKARQFINPNLFKELFYLSIDIFYKNIKDRKLWHGYHIYAIDGSKFELPNSKSNFSFFGEMFGYPNPERRFTQALASIIYDVLDDYIVHASIHPYLSSERAVAIDHLKNLEALDLYNDSIVIFDRGYYSEKFFRYCCENNITCLIRLKERLNICKKCKGDSIYTLPGKPEDHTDDITIRVIEVTLDNGSREYLATNLFDADITQNMFSELYFYRWPVETKYKELKSRLQIEDFNGATKVAVFQEFFINMLFSNLASLIKNEADEMIGISAKSSNKHRYQANRSFIIGRIKKLVPRILCGISDIAEIGKLLENAVRCRSQILPGRSFPRKRNRAKGRTHFRNQKTAL